MELCNVLTALNELQYHNRRYLLWRMHRWKRAGSYQLRSIMALHFGFPLNNHGHNQVTEVLIKFLECFESSCSSCPLLSTKFVLEYWYIRVTTSPPMRILPASLSLQPDESFDIL